MHLPEESVQPLLPISITVVVSCQYMGFEDPPGKLFPSRMHLLSTESPTSDGDAVL